MQRMMRAGRAWRGVAPVVAIALSLVLEGVDAWADDEALVGEGERIGEPARLGAALAGPCDAVALSGDGKLIAAAGEDGAVRVWERPSGELRWTLRGHRAAIRALAFGPDWRRRAALLWPETWALAMVV